VVSQVKLIAEPWDVGPGGYQVGNFPPRWMEWNGKYRDCVRDSWRGAEGTLAELAYRLSGSADLYATNGRKPFASVNFVTAHDGFTLRDLVSYDEKHNEANGEDNRDGESHNRSWNCGVEGPTDDPQVNALRARQQRNLLATLLLSQGVPMILHGDELGRTQGGNNNAYCQDGEIAWIHWDEADEELVDFTASLAWLRRDHPVFRRRRWFLGKPVLESGAKDLGWYRPDGGEMAAEDWQRGDAKALGMLLNGRGLDERDERGQPLADDTFFLALNAHPDELGFSLPKLPGRGWVVVLDTRDGRPARRLRARREPGAQEGPEDPRGVVPAGGTFALGGRSLALLQLVEEE
jgi:glycogen operon protein